MDDVFDINFAFFLIAFCEMLLSFAFCYYAMMEMDRHYTALLFQNMVLIYVALSDTYLMQCERISFHVLSIVVLTLK
jgi:hypothetical protein